MVQVPFTTSDAVTQKKWAAAQAAYLDSIADTEMLGMMKKDGTIRMQEELSKGAGDNVTIRFRGRLQEKGFINEATMTGLEKRVNSYTDNFSLFELNQATKTYAKGTISQQRVDFDLEEDDYAVLMDWMKERQTLSLFNHLAGNTATSITWDGLSYSGDERLELWGGNAPTAPTSTRMLRPNSLTTDQAVNADSTAKMTLYQIQRAEKLAATSRPYIAPLNTGTGGIKFRCYVHYDQYFDLQNDTTAPHQFREILLSQIAGAGKKEALIGKSIQFSQTEIIATDKIPYGVHGSTSAEQTNVRRAVFVGKDALGVAFGKGFSAAGADSVAGFTFAQDTQEIGRIIQSRCGLIWGVNAPTFNSIDHAKIVIATYTA